MSAAGVPDAPEMVLARYGELWLKGKNRADFEKILIQNVVRAARPYSPVTVDREQGQLAIVPERRVADVARALEDVFGFSSLSPAWGAAKHPDAIAAVAPAVVARALEAAPADRPIPFRVETRRSDKSFPMLSTELDRHVADRVLEKHGARLRVDLSHPELTLGISVRSWRAYLFAERRPGLGGLPVGTLGPVLCLLSGGIDSPVAAWLAMKRGCRVSFVSFHSPPYLGDASKEKVRRLVAALARFQGPGVLHVVPFTAVQERIRDGAPEAYRTVLYRRAMHRIAGRLAEREGALALVTGECLGQVASQTLENLTCIGAAATLPVLRPVLSFDKQETIALARRIGTYEISILPAPDCCTVFQPVHPVIRGQRARCERFEAGLELEPLLAAAVEGVERIEAE
ncbi:MAG: tRNA uracil 4-sulfurtransferase ThiI [Planctomycetota bacterium]